MLKAEKVQVCVQKVKKVWESVPKALKGWKKNVKSWESVPKLEKYENEKVHQNLPKVRKEWERVPKAEKVCQNMINYKKVCKN